MKVKYFNFLIPYGREDVAEWNGASEMKILEMEKFFEFTFPQTIKEILFIRGMIMLNGGGFGVSEGKMKVESRLKSKERLLSIFAKLGIKISSKLLVIEHIKEEVEEFRFILDEAHENPPVYLYDMGQPVYVRETNTVVECFLKSFYWKFYQDEYEEEINSLIAEGIIKAEAIKPNEQYLPDYSKNGYYNYYKEKGMQYFRKTR